MEVVVMLRCNPLTTAAQSIPVHERLDSCTVLGLLPAILWEAQVRPETCGLFLWVTFLHSTPGNRARSLSTGDDVEVASIALSNRTPFVLFGANYSMMFLNSNGWITFGVGDKETTTPAHFLGYPVPVRIFVHCMPLLGDASF
jgi:hypothetical protein